MDLEQQLREALAPCKPQLSLRATVMARVSAAARSAHFTRRAPSRVLIGTILVVAAAAAMLALQLMDSQRQPVVASAPVQQPVTATAIEPATDVPAKPLAKASGSTLQGPHALVPANSLSYSVLVQPLVLEAEDPAMRAALSELYTMVLDELRAIPALVLLVPDSRNDFSTSAPDFRLTLTGRAVSMSVSAGAVTVRTNAPTMLLATPGKWLESWAMKLAADSAPPKTTTPKQGSASEYTEVFSTSAVGTLPDTCDNPGSAATPAAPCRRARFAADSVEQLRLNVFPADPDMLLKLQARLLDSRQDPEKRFATLNTLLTYHQKGWGSGLNAEIAKGALDLATHAPEAYLRVRVWDALRGQSHPALLQPLIDMSIGEPDIFVRGEALATLIAAFKENPQARTALQSIAEADPNDFMRRVAQRGLSGDAEWNTFVLATIKNTSLPAKERLGPLAYLISTGQGEDARKLLDDEVIKALVDVIPPLMDQYINQPSGLSVMDMVAKVNSPAALDLLLASLDHVAKSEPSAQSMMLVLRLGQHIGDPRARKRLEEIAADGANPSWQGVATLALRTKGKPVLP